MRDDPGKLTGLYTLVLTKRFMIFTSCFLVFILGIRHGKIQGCVQTANFFWISKGLLALGIKQMQFAEINIHENVFAWARDRVIADAINSLFSPLTSI